MRPTLLLLSIALPLAAALVPPPEVDAAATAPVVVEVDYCTCISILLFEKPSGDSNPWIISWTREFGVDDGHCSTGACAEKAEPRPCKGSFRIDVTWPKFPTPPCTSAAGVAYQPEGQTYFILEGKLDDVQHHVVIDNVGGDAVPCESESQNPVESGLNSEPDTSVTYIHMFCGAAANTVHQRLVTVREACKNCFAEED